MSYVVLCCVYLLCLSIAALCFVCVYGRCIYVCVIVVVLRFVIIVKRFFFFFFFVFFLCIKTYCACLCVCNTPF